MENNSEDPTRNMRPLFERSGSSKFPVDNQPVNEFFTCPLTERDRPKINAHLLQLSKRDRYLRFGYAATDEHINQYVSGLNTQRDEFYALFDPNMDIVAMAHLAMIDVVNGGLSCEFGVSVNELARGHGYGSMLFERAVICARNRGALDMNIQALSENVAMLRIAKKAGATLVRDGSETQAYLRLPCGDLGSQFLETVIDGCSAFSRKLREDTKILRIFFSA